jgi:4-amino-4-deoxy-L-arabinose transferase-like glycosyltransferase
LKTLVVEPRSDARDALTTAAPYRWPGPSIKVALHRMQHWIGVPEVQVGLVATILSIAAYVYYSHAGLLFAYHDAVSHLMIARRVLVSRTPGIAQLGTGWLPLNHILMLPLVWIDPLFRDGFAGAFPSMLSYVVAAVFMYRLAHEVTGSRLASYVAAAVLLLNPNLFYMQTTAMTESDLICCTVILAYYLVQWSKTEELRDLILCALACLAATLIRYDGWALTASAAAYVLVVTWRRHGWVRARAIALLYGLLAFAGCVGWVVYNQILFGSGLDFFNGPFSAKQTQDGLAASGDLPTRHNALLSLHVYVQTVVDNLLPIVFFLAVVGLVLLILRKQSVPVLILLAPFAFNWLMLFMGITVITTPEIPFGGSASMFNVRYGLEMLPLAALCLAAVFKSRSEVSWERYAQMMLGIVFVAVLLVETGQQAIALSSYTVEDGVHGYSAIGQAMSAATYIHDHYHGGEILVSYSPFAPQIFLANLPDHDFITDSDGSTFRYALAHPASVEWIVIDTDSGNPDLVRAGLAPGWQALFTLRATIGGADIYQRIGG